jgi:ABC transporter DrrB family efflux protein
VTDLIAALEALSATNPELAPIVDDLEDMQYELDDLKDDLDDIDIDSNVSGARIKTQSTKERAQEIKQKITTLDISEQSIIGDIDTKFYSAKSTVDSVTFDLTGLNSAFLSNPTHIEQDFLFGKTRYFDYLTPAVISMVLFFLYIFITTINIVQERTRGTLLRTATTPLKKSELFGGKFLAFAGIGIIESIYVLFIATDVFGSVNNGSILAVFLIELLLIMPSLGIGLMISTIIKTERQALAVLPLVTIPAILISQTFAPIEVMPSFIRPLSYLSPMTYSNTALREIMIKGAALNTLWPEIITLLVYGLIALAAGIILYKKKIE